MVREDALRLLCASAHDLNNRILLVIISSVVRAHQSCGQEELVKCAQPLQVLTDTGLTFVASKKDLEIICPDLEDGLRCVHSYTRRCMSLQQRTHFNKLFHGTGSMIKELCSNGTYQEEYLRFAPCMRKVVPQNEICFKKYQEAMETLSRPHHNSENNNNNHNQQQQHHNNNNNNNNNKPHNNSVLQDTADDGIRSVCCSFQEYVECSTHVMRRACGDEAARFSRGFLDKMSSSMIKMHCAEFRHGSARCPHYYSGASSTSATSYLTLLALTVLTVVFGTSTIVR
ncbi:uncharacterized protein CBL_09483 [Carabus blaptoides fortunei]